jgi:hypothetical protein
MGEIPGLLHRLHTSGDCLEFAVVITAHLLQVTGQNSQSGSKPDPIHRNTS